MIAAVHICHRAVKQGYATLDFKYKCGLPDTGADLVPVVFLGLALFVLGCILVYWTLRRRSA